MCGRYLLVVPHTLPEAQRLYFESLEKYGSSYNIAPGSSMPICRMVDDKPQLTTARWGLVPHWAKDEQIDFKTINARAETIATEPAYKDAYRSRRCLVPASGYYEWATTPGGKHPYYFTTEDGALLCFAGLWETWKPQEGDSIITFTIVVCEPNQLGQEVHDRMPVILQPDHYQRWLTDPDPSDLLQCGHNDLLKVYPVSAKVNTPGNNDSTLIEPMKGIPSPTFVNR